MLDTIRRALCLASLEPGKQPPIIGSSPRGRVPYVVRVQMENRLSTCRDVSGREGLSSFEKYDQFVRRQRWYKDEPLPLVAPEFA